MNKLLGFVGLAFLGLSGCANPAAEQAHASAALWQERGPTSYVYVVRNYCYCDMWDTLRIVVQDGKVSEVTALETGLPVKWANTKTMTELVLGAEKDSETAAEFEATFDPELGYVRSLAVNQDTRADDGGYRTEVSCFAAGASEASCPLPTIDAAACAGTSVAFDPGADYLSSDPCAEDWSPIGRITGKTRVCCTKDR